MRRYFHGSALFLCILALCVSGCGGSGGSAADPMGTATVQFIDEAGKVLVPREGGGLFTFVIMPGESRQLIVWVTNARVDKDGKTTIVPVVNEYVSFTLLTPANGGSIRMVKERTDSSGRAIAMYTAGNNYAMDEVRATTEAGASAQLTILKTGGLIAKQIASLTPSSLSVPDGATSVITALVTDGNGNPVMGETVLFSFTVNVSGAYFVTASQTNVGTFSATTNASGRAEAVYLAGGNSPTLTLYDTVRAALSNGSTQSVMITRSPGTVPSGAVLALSADPSAVNGGQTTNITARVTGGTLSGANETVTLTIPVNISGGSFINAAGASVNTLTITTGGGGTATAVYRTGTNNSGTAVEDTIQGVVASSSAIGSVRVTRNAGVAGYIVTVTADPSTVVVGSISRVTANVKDNTGKVTIGAAVTFTLTGAGGIAPAAATTSGAGDAETNYTAAGAVGSSSVVTATVTIGGTSYSGSVTLIKS